MKRLCSELSRRVAEYDYRTQDASPLWGWIEKQDGVEECIRLGLEGSEYSDDWPRFGRYLLAAFGKPSTEYTDILCKVLRRRESRINYDDVLDLMFDIRDPRSIASLVETTEWAPPWDEARWYAIKSVQALRAIGSAEAIAAIERVAESHSSLHVRSVAREEMEYFEDDESE